ncbi:Crp/Fnr family transcriptional regulator [Streptomyces bingchenggensis BCW-1]|uniref:Crp/Fnr family transcriptional regulator n=1 Tax=Streptomyces bingchenggensis (strain BCW-1) TaxID=749414 RepID=D7C8E7_STRBB|nr:MULTISPECIES: Crp/Fnr family transcriptional regulator [Streptomyces]ADI06336.1 Crp/Fnr family transcriptional regulator [Streptomyces bingchenggensis BCW-1]
MSLFEGGRPFLDALPAQDRRALLALGRHRTYEPSQIVLREHDRTTFVVAITSGWATVSVETERGIRLILALRGAGEVVGDQAAVDYGSRSATVTALGRLEAVVVSGDRFRAYLAARPAATVLIMRQLSSRLRSSDGERRSLASEKVLQRLAARLVELAERTGRPEADGGISVDLPLPQHDIAAAVGSTREAVAKALRLLRDQGVVQTASRRFVVVDTALLRLLAEGRATG